MNGNFRFRGLMILFPLLAAGLLLRILYPDSCPQLINQDELLNVYDGYSISRTGADHQGNRFPVELEGLANIDHRPALQAWACAAVQWFTGFSPAACRIFSGCLSVLTAFLLFAWLRRRISPEMAVFGLILLLFMPWWIWNGRSAHEGAVWPGFSLAVFLLLRDRLTDRPNWKNLMIGGFILGFFVNAYRSHFIMVPLWLAALCVEFLIRSKPATAFRNAGFLGAGAAAGAAPQLWFMLKSPDLFFARAAEAGTGNQWDLSEKLQQLLACFHPDFLVRYGYNNLSMIRLEWIGYVLFIIGLALTLINKNNKFNFPLNRPWMLLLLFSVLLPGLLFNENPHALRISAFPVLIAVYQFSALLFVSERLAKKISEKMKVAGISLLFLLSSGYTMIHVFRNEESGYAGQQPQLVKLAAESARYTRGADSIWINGVATAPYIYFAAFQHRPEEVQQWRRSSWIKDAEGKPLVTGPYHFADNLSIERAYLSSPDHSRKVYITFGYRLPGAIPADSVLWREWKYLIYRSGF